MKKVGFVALYGRANAGKSSILNKILGYKIQAVSEKPQTTRENIRGIYNDEDSQIIFCDTPGLFKPHAKLGTLLLKDASVAKDSNDLVVFVVDASTKISPTFKKDFDDIPCPVIIAFNKIDLITKDVGEARIKEYQALAPEAKIIEISCKRNYGIKNLIDAIKEFLDEGEVIYPEDIISDRPNSFIYSEIIREKCMRNLEKEVPHAIHIEIKNVKETDDEIDIVADICVEKDSEKGIVIGKQGKMISTIRKYSQNAIQGFTGKKVYLDLLVKVIPDWRNNQYFLKEHGYSQE